MATTTTSPEPQAEATATSPPLEVENLHVAFDSHAGTVHAVNGVNYGLAPGETLGILGESGSGKSVSLEAVMGIVKSPPGRVSGAIRFRGTDLLTASQRVRREIRGDKIAMIFQDAITSLNPSLTVGYQISEVYRLRRRCSRKEARERAIELMARVRIPAAKERVDSYPHEFSGGMCQRVMIASALALDPEILIADEPTTALDVTVQRQIMTLLKELQEETGMALILVTHDLGVVAEAADRAIVMYAGRIAESASIGELFARPAHPYTKGLMHSIPRPEKRAGKLAAIGGTPPNLARIPPGCAFHPRCRYREAICRSEQPALREVGARHESACHFAKEVMHG